MLFQDVRIDQKKWWIVHTKYKPYVIMWLIEFFYPYYYKNDWYTADYF
jgi:hypothetical protein